MVTGEGCRLKRPTTTRRLSATSAFPATPIFSPPVPLLLSTIGVYNKLHTLSVLSTRCRLYLFPPNPAPPPLSIMSPTFARPHPPHPPEQIIHPGELTPSQHLGLAQLASRSFDRVVRLPLELHDEGRAEQRRLVVAYWSYDFRAHPMGHLTRGLFCTHRVGFGDLCNRGLRTLLCTALDYRCASMVFYKNTFTAWFVAICFGTQFVSQQQCGVR